MTVKVKAFMSGDPVAIRAEASALEALDRMLDRGIRHLPVIDAEHRVIGVLALEDLRAALPIPPSNRGVPSPEAWSANREWQVGEIMTRAPQTLHTEDSLQEAVETMADQHIGCLPIVDESGHLEGILTERDVLHALATALWSEQIPERRRRERELHGLVEQIDLAPAE